MKAKAMQLGATPIGRAGACMRSLATAGAAVLLVSCGGGDSDDSVSVAPLATEPAVLKVDLPGADSLARTAINTSRRALRLARHSDALDEIERLTRDLLPDIFESSSDGNALTVDCRRRPLQFAPFLCYGELTFEANRRTFDGTVVATTVFNLQFDNFQVLTPGFDRLRISGGVRLDYLTNFTLEPRRGTVRYQSSGLSTNKDGTIVSATDGALTVQTGDGTVIIETDRERLVNLGASTSSDTDGTLNSGTARVNFQAGYVDFDWRGWPLVSGSPQTGAQVAVTGANGGAATITVREVRADGALVEVVFTDAGLETRFEVFVPD